jgi:RNA polymerase sigma-70 factor (ECF subfamily)
MFNNNALIEEMPDLRRFALRLTGSACDADDLLQATILRAIEKKHLFQSDTNLNRWACKIMFNLFVSAYRRKSKFETRYDPELYLEKMTEDASQEHIVELGQVERAMQKLSPEHREIIVLICVKGMRYQEASEALNLPVGTVRSRLSRARECLQALREENTMSMPLPAAHEQAHIAA